MSISFVLSAFGKKSENDHGTISSKVDGSNVRQHNIYIAKYVNKI